MTAQAWLTPPQVAKQLGIEPSKVIAWINNGELSAVNCAEKRDGKRPRWKLTQEAVDAFLESRRNPQPVARRTRAPRQIQRKEYV